MTFASHHLRLLLSIIEFLHFFRNLIKQNIYHRSFCLIATLFGCSSLKEHAILCFYLWVWFVSELWIPQAVCLIVWSLGMITWPDISTWGKCIWFAIKLHGVLKKNSASRLKSPSRPTSFSSSMRPSGSSIFSSTLNLGFALCLLLLSCWAYILLTIARTLWAYENFWRCFVRLHLGRS